VTNPCNQRIFSLGNNKWYSQKTAQGLKHNNQYGMDIVFCVSAMMAVIVPHYIDTKGGQTVYSVDIKRTELKRYVPVFTTALILTSSQVNENTNKGVVTSEADKKWLPLVKLLHAVQTQE
jgi:hypothetical protein